MKNYRYNKIIAAGMALIMTASLLGGCGNGGQQAGGIGTEGTGNMTSDGSGQTGEQPDSAAMGRYLEEVTDLSGIINGYQEELFALQDGKITIMQTMDYVQVSKDHGATWEAEECEWLYDLFDQGIFIEDYAVGPDGTIGVVYIDKQAEEVEDSVDDNFIEGTEEDFLAGYSDMKALIVRPDGTQIPVTLPKEEEEGPQHIWIADDGKAFVGTFNPDLYEITEDGSGKVYLTLENDPQLIQFVGSRMIIDGYGYDNLLIYDMETKEYIEDAVLNDFVKENYGDRTFNGGSWFDLFFFAGGGECSPSGGAKRGPPPCDRRQRHGTDH